MIIKANFFGNGRCSFFNLQGQDKEDTVKCYKNPLWGFIVSIFIKTIKIHYNVLDGEINKRKPNFNIDLDTRKTLYVNQESFRTYAKAMITCMDVPDQIMDENKKIEVRTAELFLEKLGKLVTPQIKPFFPGAFKKL